MIIIFCSRLIVDFYSKKELRTNEKKKNKKIADIDSLTNALSRSYFERWKKIFNTNDEGDGWFTLIMIDVDNLKQINDVHGHLLGDDILRKVGKKIAQSLRANDLFVRFGGDEFILILEDCPRDIAEKNIKTYYYSINAQTVTIAKLKQLDALNSIIVDRVISTAIIAAATIPTGCLYRWQSKSFG